MAEIQRHAKAYRRRAEVVGNVECITRASSRKGDKQQQPGHIRVKSGVAQQYGIHHSQEHTAICRQGPCLHLGSIKLCKYIHLCRYGLSAVELQHKVTSTTSKNTASCTSCYAAVTCATSEPPHGRSKLAGCTTSQLLCRHRKGHKVHGISSTLSTCCHLKLI